MEALRVDDPCPPEESILAIYAGNPVSEPTRAHVWRCVVCRRALGTLYSDHALGEPPGMIQYARTLPAGTLLDRYTIEGVAGRGAMGVVYMAHDPKLDRRVALKLLNDSARENAAHDPERLMREARALARLAHPHVVSVYDVGMHQDRIFVVMEFVAGTTLSTWLAQADRSTHEIVDVFCQAGLGLAAAHEAGLVHRDFKPDNVLIGEDGRVRVTDFGLARIFGSSDGILSGSPEAPGGSVTQTGTVLGTPAYMAPEQRAGAQADARSDQYSFCVALSEALTGKRPAPDGPPQLDRKRLKGAAYRAVRRGLAHDPHARLPNMCALVGALRETGLSAWQKAVGLAAAFAVLWTLAARAPHASKWSPLPTLVLAPSAASVLPGPSDPPPARTLDRARPTRPKASPKVHPSESVTRLEAPTPAEDDPLSRFD